jgi:hypothetical protein
MKIISRAEAKTLGLKHYFTGEPCKRGHIAERMVSSRDCPECARALRREWRAANPERQREHYRAWQAANPEKNREKERKWRAANPEKARERARRWWTANKDKVNQRRAARREAARRAGEQGLGAGQGR